MRDVALRQCGFYAVRAAVRNRVKTFGGNKMNVVKRVWKALVPVVVRNMIYFVFRRPFVLLANSLRERRERRKVVAWLKANGEACIANGVWEEGADRTRLDDIIAYLEKKPLTFWPGSYHYKHNPKDLYKQTFYSKEYKRFYVLYKNRKIYMKEGMSKKQAAGYFNTLLLDQDKDSPHYYQTDETTFTGNEVVVDAGAAEGIFACDVLDRVKRVYAFECDTEWLESLRLTFAGTDKVVVVPMGLGCEVQEGFTTLDEYFKGERVDFIKADIEGSECDMIHGGSKTLEKTRKAVICAYHRENDARDLKELLKDAGFSTEFAAGFVIRNYANYEKLQPPYLRRGVIYASKE